jgi:hypothetical protein
MRCGVSRRTIGHTCSPEPTGRQARSLAHEEAIVRAYISRCRDHARRELALFNTAHHPSLRAVVRAAALSQVRGKRHSHQRRIPGKSLEAAAAALEKANLTRACSFEDLHDRVVSAIGQIVMTGPLTTYDINRVIGACPMRMKLIPMN